MKYSFDLDVVSFQKHYTKKRIIYLPQKVF